MAEGTVWDPLRRKNVALTPEERVRQWFISVLRDSMGVPQQLMMSEAPFELGGKRMRADILVYDRGARPLAIVECKRPEVALDASVLDQTVRYNMVLDVRYVFITNGTHTYVARREGGKFAFMDRMPVYGEMLEI